MVVTIWDLGEAHLNVTANNIFLMQLNYMEVLEQHNFFPSFARTIILLLFLTRDLKCNELFLWLTASKALATILSF